MLVLDRIFDGHDVERVLAVDFSDEGGKCRRLTRAGRSADEDETAWQLSEERDVVREMQVGNTGNAGGQRANGCGRAPALVMQVHAEASETFQREPEID